jgi:hypothetical protein
MPNYVELGAELPQAGGLGLFPDSAKIVVGAREQRVPPKELQARLTLVGGLNPFGEPRLRLIWGWKPTEFIFNKREGHYELRPRYFLKKSRWHVEQWFPPEFYGTPQMWRHNFTENINGKEIDLCGPYPSRGGYEHLVTVERGGEYIELTPHVCDDLVNRLRISREITPSQRKSETWSKIQDYYDKPDPVADAIVDDAMPAFRSAAHAVLDNTSMSKGRE